MKYRKFPLYDVNTISGLLCSEKALGCLKYTIEMEKAAFPFPVVMQISASYVVHTRAFASPPASLWL